MNNTGLLRFEERCKQMMWARALSRCKRRGRSGSGSEAVLYRGMTHHGMVVNTEGERGIECLGTVRYRANQSFEED